MFTILKTICVNFDSFAIPAVYGTRDLTFPLNGTYLGAPWIY